MEILRTPDACFENLPGYDFEPHYVEVPDGEGGTLRIHYLDEGPADAPPVLLMHGEPTWSYLCRKMIPIIVNAGLRVVAPDLVGFGRSDKPTCRENYTYQRHVDWMCSFIEALDLRVITLVGQDWGGLIGLRLATEHEDRFARIVAANTMLPTGDGPTRLTFKLWRLMSQIVPGFPVGRIIGLATMTYLSKDVIAAYDAPFPDGRYKAGALVFPMLVPTKPDDPAAPANRAAWEVLRRWEKPFLTTFSNLDPIMRGLDKIFQRQIPGAKGQPHTIIHGAGHFLQEDKGEELAQVVVDFVAGSA